MEPLMEQLMDDLECSIYYRDEIECINILEKISKFDTFDVNMTKFSYPHCTLLILASKLNLVKVFQFLIDKLNADVNINDSYGVNAMYYAIINGNTEIIDILISCDSFNINYISDDTCKETILHQAIMSANADRVIPNILKHTMIDTTIQDQFGYTAKELADAEDHIEVSEMIANYEPSISIINNK